MSLFNLLQPSDHQHPAKSAMPHRVERLDRSLRPAVALGAGFMADRIFADPQRAHPVALYGRAAQALIDHWYADSRSRGALFTATAIGVPTIAAVLISRRAPHIALAVSTWAALGGTTLGRTGTRMADRLDAGDVEGARELVPWLCSRDPSALDPDGIARATVESLAENTSDAVSATLLWGALLGAPGVVMHRAANTLDAMVGYKEARWRNFGWASARFDDLLGWLPARLTGVATALAGPRHVDAMRAWRQTARMHPSPNAGVVESTAAGALGVLLGGKTQYRSGVEMRPVLGVVGSGSSAPSIKDVRRAVALTSRVQQVVLVSCMLLCVSRGLMARG